MSLPDEPTGDEFDVDAAFPEQDEPESTERQPLTAKTVAVAGARTVAGLVGIGVAAATIAAAVLLPLPTITSVPASLTVIPVPTAQQVVCAGSVLRLADDTGAGATTVSALGRPDLGAAASDGDVSTTSIEVSDASTGGTPSAPVVVSTPPSAPDATQSVLVSGAQSELVSEGDFVGLAAAGCDVANGESWLAGGSTEVGRTTLISLTNPSEVAATVNLELFGEDGPIVAPGTSGIIVPANGQRVLSLAGFQPDIVSPVVHVTSTGGQVSATLQEAIVRGLAPGGVDIISSSALSTETVIPGVLVTGLEAVQALRVGGDPQFDDVEPALRVFAPGEGTVTLTVSVTPENGAGTGTSFALDIDAGRVTDVPIEQLATGSYTISVDSTQPVVAAARVTSAVGPVTDFAWFAASSLLRGTAQVTAAPGPSPVLHLANPTTSDAQVLVGDKTVAVPAESSAVIALEPGQTYALSGFEFLHAAVTLAGGGMIAGYGVHPPGAVSGSIVVYP